MAQFLARMVMPRSRSMGFESRMSPCCPPSSFSSSPERKLPDCLSRLSTSVVLPWSTWAMMATLRISERFMVGSLPGALFQDVGRGEICYYSEEDAVPHRCLDTTHKGA